MPSFWPRRPRNCGFPGKPPPNHQKPTAPDRRGGILRTIPHPGHFDAKGTEHTVRFRGLLVEKHQHSDGWAAFLNQDGMVSIRPALPTEYLRRLEFQNELFGDHIQILGLTRATRFVTTQPTLRGGDLRNENSLRSQGWHVVTIWECALKTTTARKWLARRIPKLLS